MIIDIRAFHFTLSWCFIFRTLRARNECAGHFGDGYLAYASHVSAMLEHSSNDAGHFRINAGSLDIFTYFAIILPPLDGAFHRRHCQYFATAPVASARK